MTNKVPKIRFKGFTDDWEQRKLGDECEITMGQSPAGNTYSEVPTDFILVQGNADLKDGWVYPRIWTTQKTKTADAGDLIMSVRAPAGAMGKTAYDVVLGRGVAGIKGDEFIFQLLSKMNDDGYWKKVSAGSTFESINSNDIKDSTIKMPLDKIEQQKIGEYFSNLDHLITLHQRKCEQTKELKKFMLQKMFPKKGEKNPEIRFPGFTDDWEQRKFANIAERKSETETSNSILPSVEYEDIISGQGILNKNVFEKNIEKTGIAFTSEDILYGKLRPYLHNWLNPNFTGVAVGDWWVLRPINVDKNFLFRLIQTSQYDKAANQSTGTKMPRADWKLISDLEFRVPSVISEQQKIGEYFSNLDHLITLHQRKCEQLKELKKFMLQNMFPKKG